MSNTTAETVAERVQAGVAYLDARTPDWRKRIRPDIFDIGDPFRCVLGQVYSATHGDYWGFMHNFEMNSPERAGYGFEGYGSDDEEGYGSDDEEDWALLQAEWLREFARA